MALFLALAIGFVSGLRTFTSLAAIFLERGGVWGYVLGVCAIGEYVADAMPWIPSRTAPPSLIVRSVSGAIAGWFIAGMHDGNATLGAIAGIIGALIGAFGGRAARAAAIAAIGALPAALLEDVVAIGLAFLIVTR
ncbi:MAG: hypothetical protein ABSE64_11220 [Vulcanimicrobiaceae bacterium]